MGARADQGGHRRAGRGASDVYPMVEEYNSVDRYRRFAADLQKRGWSEARLEKLMGGNFLRVYREAGAAEPQNVCSTSSPRISTQSCLRSSHTEKRG